MYWLDIVAVALFFSTTLLLYTYRLTEITPGMWGGEVGLGWMVNDVAAKHYFIPFLPFNYGHPTLLVYLSAIAIHLLGRSMFSLRIISVVFGALSASAFYILCRLFFKRSIALSTSLLFATSYILIVVSRFAYEMSGAVFFFIVTCIGIQLLFRKERFYAVLLIGLSSGLGLYTYIAFRTLIPVLLGIPCFIIFYQKKYRIRLLAILLLSFFIISFPLIAYGIKHPDQINARVNALSVFNQHLPASEVIKELQGASIRSITLFGFTQDPNPRQNPGNVSPFDLVTSLLFLGGLAYLWIKKPAMAMFVTLLILIILITEIVTLERIPNFHYYGLGHPNTLRIALLVPLVIFCAGWSFQIIERRFFAIRFLIISLLVIFISLINLYPYYGQSPNKWIYATNFVIPLKIIDTLNAQKPNQVALSPTLYNLQHVQYFLNPKIVKTQLSFTCSPKSLPKGISVVLAEDLSLCSAVELQILRETLSNQEIQNPWNSIDAIIFTK